MNFLHRQFLKLAAVVAAAAAVPQFASALDYPTRPVRIIAGFAAGGGVDVTARLIGQWLTDRLGQSFVIGRSSCRVTKQASGMASACPGTRPLKSSTSSTRKSMRRSPTPR